ncbi:hypothetical protein L3Q82_025112, partial [Scortum barcoo]
MKVLVSTYKADQKKGKKGEKRKEKRQMELGILQLFEEEGQRLIEAAKEKFDQGIEEMNKNVKETKKLMAEINTPFSHVDAVKKPPPYEKEVKFKEIYPQLPVICQEGNYRIRDDEDRIIEEGQAETTIKMQKQDEVQERLSEQRRSTVQPGDKVFVKVFRRKWYNERREGPFEVVRSTGTAVQVKGSPTWYHLSHCVKAPKEEIVSSQSEDVEGSREPEEDRQAMDSVDGCVSVFDDAGDTDADNGQGGKFSEIDFQYVPETGDFVSGQSEAPKVSKDCDSTA